MAERAGFEPAVQVAPDNCLAGSPVRPLQHLTAEPRYCTLGPFRCKVAVHGGMAEWSKAPVLKTGEVHASVGSNPTPSATAYPNLVAFPNELQAFTVSRG